MAISSPLFLLGLNVNDTAVDPLAAYALALDFKNGAYWKAGVQAASLSAMAGYSYSRTGQVSFVNSGGTVTDFAANVPPVLSGIGYEAVGALTNLQTNSQAVASWVDHAGSTITTDATVAPDGTTTADTMTETAATSEHRGFSNVITLGAATVYTSSIFAKIASGTRYVQLASDAAGDNGRATFDITLGTLVNATTSAGYIIACGSGWYRLVRVQTAAGGVTANYIELSNGVTTAHPSYAGDGTSGAYLWQVQTIQGNFPDGGPIIATAGATASIGAQALSVSVPNATYSAVYTFSDNSTQTISTTVAGGAFNMPAYPATLNLPTVSRVTLI